eukprot:scaffold121006_cov69-Phaeocystis_antarctica.AAC.2
MAPRSANRCPRSRRIMARDKRRARGWWRSDFALCQKTTATAKKLASSVSRHSLRVGGGTMQHRHLHVRVHTSIRPARLGWPHILRPKVRAPRRPSHGGGAAARSALPREPRCCCHHVDNRGRDAARRCHDQPARRAGGAPVDRGAPARQPHCYHSVEPGRAADRPVRRQEARWPPALACGRRAVLAAGAR